MLFGSNLGGGARSGPVASLYRPASRRGPKTGAPRRAIAGSRGAARRAGPGYGAPVSRPNAGHPPKARAPVLPYVSQVSGSALFDFDADR
jgi:hypothetical protein